MPSRWKNDRPLSRTEFEARFPDDAACALYLAARRWPGGFVCPCCDEREGWELRRERITWQCTSCGRQTSVTAGTVIHDSHVPLRLWFMAVHIITSHSNGISALQLQAQLPSVPMEADCPTPVHRRRSLRSMPPDVTQRC